MNKIILNDSFNNLSYDWFVWSNPLSINNADLFIYLFISDIHLQELSKKIFERSLEMVIEIPDYFQEFEEPFPADSLEICNNPLLLNSYFRKSTFWRNTIIEELSLMLAWDMDNSQYLLIKFNEVKIIEDKLFFMFYGASI